MWLGEQITQRGIGNGISLIIFAGIVKYLGLVTTFELGRTGAVLIMILAIFILLIVSILFVVFMEDEEKF